MSPVRTSLLAGALFVVVHALAPSVEEPADAQAAVPVATAIENPCRADGCGCPHERVLEACCCADESETEVVPTPRPRPLLEPLDTVVNRAHDGLPRTALVPFRCAGSPRSSGGVPQCPLTIVAPASEVALADGTCTWEVWPDARPPREHASEPAIPPPRFLRRAASV